MTLVAENDKALEQAGEFITNLLEEADLLTWYEQNILETPNSNTGFDLALVELEGELEVLAKVTPPVRKVAANILSAILPDHSTLGFWKGNQFISITPREEEICLASVLQNGLAKLRDHSFYLPDGIIFCANFSAAVAHFRPEATLHEAVAEAQSILDLANSAGGNCILAQNQVTRRNHEENRNILLAEDDPTTAALIKHRLKKENYTITHATTGLQALELAGQQDFGLCLFDVKMPEMDGFEVLTRLRSGESNRDTPIIIMTAVSDDKALVRAFDLGADDFLTKPFSPLELAARVHRLIHRKTVA